MSSGSITSAATTTPTTTSSDAFASMSSSQFIKIITSELANQNPFQPDDSSTLLSEISNLQNIDSQQQMQSVLGSLVLQDQIASGGNLIGKTVAGNDSSGNGVTGVVSGVQVANSAVSLVLDSGATMPIGNVTTIAATGTGSTTGN
jgi:flagellar basal-body rod modification protein FlgD